MLWGFVSYPRDGYLYVFFHDDGRTVLIDLSSDDFDSIWSKLSMGARLPHFQRLIGFGPSCYDRGIQGGDAGCRRTIFGWLKGRILIYGARKSAWGIVLAEVMVLVAPCLWTAVA